MFAAARFALASRMSARAFSSTPRSQDLQKLVLIGRLAAQPELKKTKNDKEYVRYTVATNQYPPPPPNPDGSYSLPRTTWHHITSFAAFNNNYLTTVPKGSTVYVEASFDLREPDPSADTNTPQGQRQIFLRHETLRMITRGREENQEENTEHESS